MAEITKCYRQEVPALRFIGKKYGDEDRVDESFGARWGEFFEKGWFARIEGLVADTKAIYEDGDAYVGLMRFLDNEPFQYWIGMFMPEGTPVPEGFGFVDFDRASLGVCWVHGPEDQVYMQEERCAIRLAEEKLEVIADDQGAYWFFERYGCPRFTTPDEKGNIVLDICHYVK